MSIPVTQGCELVMLRNVNKPKLRFARQQPVVGRVWSSWWRVRIHYLR